MDDQTLIAALSAVRAVPVLRSADAAEAVTVGRELARGGLNVVELTFSTPHVERAIGALRDAGGIVVGAGTVLTEGQARSAVGAGAQFLVSPVCLPWLPELAAELGVPAIPGAATPTEVWSAHLAGAAAVKVFPVARLGGADYIRDLLAPLPSLRLMGTGGVGLPLARELIHAGCLAVGLGSIHRDATLGRDATARARAVREALNGGPAAAPA